MLYKLLTTEREKRNSGEMLLLSDRMTLSGQSFTKKIGIKYDHLEHEIYLDYDLLPYNHLSKNIAPFLMYRLPA